jgi:hypothetical protein
VKLGLAGGGSTPSDLSLGFFITKIRFFYSTCSTKVSFKVDDDRLKMDTLNPKATTRF